MNGTKWAALAVAAFVFAGGLAAGETGSAKKKSAAPAKSEEKAAKPDLLDPASLKATAPDVFKVRFETSKGPFVIEVQREWAPRGADRFYNLVTAGYYDDVRFFRVVAGFMAQFGLHGTPEVSKAWKPWRMNDDPVMQSNTRGTVTFAMSGPNTRTTQLFINFVDNSRLDSMGFSPFGKVVEGMEVVDSLFAGYGEGRPRGRGPDQNRISAEGNAYLAANFPDLDYVKTARVVE
jgi:peptidyl-prolyl cis-trans isomerase A (cyclophilin A)